MFQRAGAVPLDGKRFERLTRQIFLVGQVERDLHESPCKSAPAGTGAIFSGCAGWWAALRGHIHRAMSSASSSSRPPNPWSASAITTISAFGRGPRASARMDTQRGTSP